MSLWSDERQTYLHAQSKPDWQPTFHRDGSVSYFHGELLGWVRCWAWDVGVDEAEEGNDAWRRRLVTAIKKHKGVACACAWAGQQSRLFRDPLLEFLEEADK